MLEHFNTLTTILVVLLNILSIYVYRAHASKPEPLRPKRSENVLLVTAHPDDECMFFAPTILQLHHHASEVHLLCLSTGNFDNQGKVREKELIQSCAVLGIPKDRVINIDDSDLPDSPDVTWPVLKVADIVLKYVEERNIGAVITFDDYGVSGHPNHIACHAGVRLLVHSKRLPDQVVAMSLHSTNILRKYSGYLDVFWSALSSHVCFSSPSEALQAQRAMTKHVSQYVWFRMLYVLFSRYMVVNTLNYID